MNYKIKEINNQLVRLKKSKFGEDWVYKLLKLIEEKIYSTKGEVDIKSFSSLVKELKLDKVQEKQLVSLRNRMFHSNIKARELKDKEKWLKNEIIPKVLEYREREVTLISNYIEFTDTIYSKLIQLANEKDFKFQKTVEIKIGKRNYKIDALLEVENEIILLEITSKADVANLSSTKEQLIIYLNATTVSGRRGIIITPGAEFEIITEFDNEILIFGANNDFSLIYDWISKPEQYKKINVFLSYSSIDFDYFNIFKIVESLRNFDIGKIYYFEEDSKSNIVEYLSHSLLNTDVFILFCSERSLRSEAVKMEWQAALKIKTKIIPVFENEADIPSLLSTKLGIKYDENNLEETTRNLLLNLKEIKKIILKKN